MFSWYLYILFITNTDPYSCPTKVFPPFFFSFQFNRQLINFTLLKWTQLLSTLFFISICPFPIWSILPTPTLNPNSSFFSKLAPNRGWSKDKTKKMTTSKFFIARPKGKPALGLLLISHKKTSTRSSVTTGPCNMNMDAKSRERESKPWKYTTWWC